VSYFDELVELLEIESEEAKASERFEVLATVRAVFGDDVEIIEFEPYDSEGNTTSRRAI
jgi:hypothetical protein